MNAIMRLWTIIAMLCLALLAFKAHSASAQTTGSQGPEVCRTEEPRDLTEEYRWRWRAYQNLSCLISKLEEARTRPAAAGNDAVTLPREEIDHLLQLAWSGRDAAQRIAR